MLRKLSDIPAGAKEGYLGHSEAAPIFGELIVLALRRHNKEESSSRLSRGPLEVYHLRSKIIRAPKFPLFPGAAAVCK